MRIFNVTIKEALLFVLLLGVLFIRLFGSSYSSFINDEPALQKMVDEYQGRGELPTLGLAGSQPIRYGPTAVWFYSLIRIFGDNFETIFLAHALLHIVMYLLLFFVIAKLFSREIAFYALFFATSAPFLVQYSRLPWDNTFLIILSPLLMLNVVSIYKNHLQSQNVGELNTSLFALAGGLSALMINTHLMVSTMILITGACLLSANLKTSVKQQILPYRGVFKIATVKPFWGFLAGFIIIFSPYLFGLLGDVHALRTVNDSYSNNSWEGFFYLPEIFRNFGVQWSLPDFAQYFLKPSIAPITSTYPILGWLFTSDFSWFLRVPLLIFLFLPLLRVIPRAKKSLHEVPHALFFLWEFSAAVWLGMVFLYAYKDRWEYPHYYSYLWWVPVVVLALSIQYLPKPVALYLKCAVIITVVINSIALAMIYNFLIQNQGTRGLEFGATVGNQKKAIQTVCSKALNQGQSTVTLDISRVILLKRSLDYFFKREPLRQGLILNIGITDSEYYLKYLDNDPTSAVLVVQKS